MLEKVLGRSLARKHTAARAGDVRHTLADISKGKELLGLEPRIDFEEGFRRTVDYFRGVKG
jgi:UDP-glucose 4-epimerase